MKAINPATGELIKEYAEHNPDEVSDIIELVDSEQGQWRATSMAHRSERMLAAAAVMVTTTAPRRPPDRAATG